MIYTKWTRTSNEITMDWISLDGWINNIKSIRKRGTKLFHSNHKHLEWQKHVLIWKWNCIFGQNNCSIICHNSNILKCFLQINEYFCTVQLHTTMRPLVFSCLPPNRMIRCVCSVCELRLFTLILISSLANWGQC